MSALPSSVTDPSVIEFLSGWSLTDAPVRIPYTNLGYAPDFCHVSSKAHALQHGGKRVHGWALWDYGQLGVMGNFHSVWQDTDDVLIDMTPPKFGTNEVLFVRDRTIKIVANFGYFDMPANRMAIPFPIHIDVATGDQANSPQWPLYATNTAFAAYCAQHLLAISDYATDAVHG